MSETRDRDFLPDPLNPIDDEAVIEDADGERTLDPDVDDGRVTSIDADRAAASGEDDVEVRPVGE